MNASQWSPRPNNTNGTLISWCSLSLSSSSSSLGFCVKRKREGRGDGATWWIAPLIVDGNKPSPRLGRERMLFLSFCFFPPMATEWRQRDNWTKPSSPRITRPTTTTRSWISLSLSTTSRCGFQLGLWFLLPSRGSHSLFKGGKAKKEEDMDFPYGRPARLIWAKTLASFSFLLLPHRPSASASSSSSSS